MLLSDELVTTQTMGWVKEFIVALNVCPFAKREVEKDSVRCVVLRSKKVDVALEELMTEVQWLDENPETETTLLIFPTLFKDFHRYLDFVETAENLMFEQGCEGVYQLATFHPDYCFAGTEPDDVSNYTNRSPYPMLHLLREASVDKAIEFYGDTAEIPEQNIEKMEQLGKSKLDVIFADCMKVDHD
ncbi:DUF1415 domain-containing protein [Marinomonas sp. CT5]|uniref:DUF1415 domain-containing protein n=1 Tax=Marinomonas sp. CT5 TaxID=2066133 RepID=UPI0017C98F8E|nr:DUF1415 domain-containing protein [Marinomonas sp. CT5]NVK73633.1 DUF1415 domain-containing protein [Oceanospirillaceae bacterium]QUX95740.1 DUF1415 domain-containing protein [Marinomonas sp. CT5]